jgi:hypothetical protein
MVIKGVEDLLESRGMELPPQIQALDFNPDLWREGPQSDAISAKPLRNAFLQRHAALPLAQLLEV